MTLFQDAVGTPRAAAQFGDVLAWYGAIGDAASGNMPGFALQKASVAVALGSTAALPAQVLHATFFAGMLHAIGAIGNEAFRKDVDRSERAARTARWDIPALGARACSAIAALPPLCAQLVRWQAESWDGTGFPDQLRWDGIPVAAQHLALADAFARASDPEEALTTIALQGGRTFGPDTTRTFIAWFHTTGGEFQPSPAPREALDLTHADPGALLDEIADRVDAHNAVSGRWRRIDALAQGTAAALGLDTAATRALALATRLFGAGELHERAREDDEFDPLSRFGIEQRSRNAEHATALVAPCTTFGAAAEILATRAQWYDGTATPHGIRSDDVPLAARILSASIAFTRLDRSERLQRAAGTQFDPVVVRALLEVEKTRA